ncbi:MAG TPA: DNA-binding protein [Fluviicoccus sp.]|nr:DNA-binding protein [Fluviicoccus sp.]
MPQTKILVDSNSYFRLAKSIHPLLFREFGDQQYCLYVLKELDEEYAVNARLKNKFPWVSDPELADNRSHYLAVGRKQKKEIELAFDYIWDHVQTVHKGPSRIDVLYLAHAYVLGLTVVTDDRDMLAVAEEFNISTRKTLSLMRLMCDCGHLDEVKVREIVEYWRYMGDRPADMEKDYRRLFQDEDSG